MLAPPKLRGAQLPCSATVASVLCADFEPRARRYNPPNDYGTADIALALI